MSHVSHVAPSLTYIALKQSHDDMRMRAKYTDSQVYKAHYSREKNWVELNWTEWYLGTFNEGEAAVLPRDEGDGSLHFTNVLLGVVLYQILDESRFPHSWRTMHQDYKWRWLIILSLHNWDCRVTSQFMCLALPALSGVHNHTPWSIYMTAAKDPSLSHKASFCWHDNPSSWLVWNAIPLQPQCAMLPYALCVEIPLIRADVCIEDWTIFQRIESSLYQPYRYCQFL